MTRLPGRLRRGHCRMGITGDARNALDFHAEVACGSATHGPSTDSVIIEHRASTRFLRLLLRTPSFQTGSETLPYNAFLDAPVISAASFAAVDGGRCSISFA